MAEFKQELVDVPEEVALNKWEILKEEQKKISALQTIANTYPEEQRPKVYRNLVLLTQIKTITVTEQDGSQWGKKVTRNLSLYEAAVMNEICLEYGLNPLMNFVIFLEGNQVYITLAGHLQNAHQSGQFVWLEVTMNPDKTDQKRNITCKVIVKRRIGEEVYEFEGKGLANDTNVRWGAKKDDNALAQMAEARATRRALSRAFPIGLPYAEDYFEDPNFEKPEQATALPTGIAASLSAWKSTEPVEMAPAPEVTKAPAKRASKKVEVEAVEAKPTDDDETHVELVAEVEASKEVSVDAQTATPEGNKVENIEPVSQYASMSPGIDQLARMKDLYAKLGIDQVQTMSRIKEINTREEAAERIGILVKAVEQHEKEVAARELHTAKAPVATAEAEAVFEWPVEVDLESYAKEPEATEQSKEEIDKAIASKRESLSAKMREYNKAMEDNLDDTLIESLREEVMSMRADLKAFKELYWITD